MELWYFFFQRPDNLFQLDGIRKRKIKEKNVGIIKTKATHSILRLIEMETCKIDSIATNRKKFFNYKVNSLHTLSFILMLFFVSCWCFPLFQSPASVRPALPCCHSFQLGYICIFTVLRIDQVPNCTAVAVRYTHSKH